MLLSSWVRPAWQLPQPQSLNRAVPVMPVELFAMLCSFLRFVHCRVPLIHQQIPQILEQRLGRATHPAHLGGHLIFSLKLLKQSDHNIHGLFVHGVSSLK